MNLADIQWFYLLTAFVVGGIAGAFLYRYLNAGAVQNSRVRHQLTERELELSQVKESLNDHFSRTATSLANLGKQLQNMEEQLLLDADQLVTDQGLIKRLGQRTEASPVGAASYQPPKDYAPVAANKAKPDKNLAAAFEPPKDYSSNTGGTLAEDFGLRPENPVKS